MKNPVDGPVDRRAGTVALILCLGALLGVLPATAQTNAETSSAWIQLNLSVPGARSLGLGGAFLGLADDATAAFANPAGVALLPGLEFSLEGRGWEFEHRYSPSGSVALENRPESLREARKDNQTWNFSFASVTYGGRRWGVSAYFHQLADFTAKFETDGVRVGPQTRLFPTDIRHEVDIENVGVSGALSFADGRWALGLGVHRYRLYLDSLQIRYRLTELDEVDVPRETANIHDEQRQFSTPDSAEASWLVGVLWRPRLGLGVGAVYRRGAELSYKATTAAGTAFGGQSEQGPVSPDPVFRIPDVVGIGVLWAPRKVVRWEAGGRKFEDKVFRLWKFVGDIYGIEYSVFGEDVRDVFRLCGPEDPGSACKEAELNRFRASDGVEVHLGAERRFPWTWLRFLRVGVWYEPEHALRFEGKDLGFSFVFQRGTYLLHRAVGFGTGPVRLGSSGFEVQADLALDWSQRVRTGSLSMVLRRQP